MRQVKIEDLGMIRFISAPRGGAPLSIREKWIDIEVPCLFSHDGVPPNSGDTIRDVETGFEVSDYPGYIVLQTYAIAALQQKCPEAAEYWMERGFPNSDYALFLFNFDSAEVVKPVKTREDFWQCFGGD